MALLFTYTTTNPLSSLSPPWIRTASSAHPYTRLCNNSHCLKPKTFLECKTLAPFVLKERDALTVKASSDINGTGSVEPGSPAPPSESNEGSLPVDKLPLESKLQQKLEQQMRMKAAKKIRLRRKRLLRKRHLRKIGRWPPSKLKKNKNV